MSTEFSDRFSSKRAILSLSIAVLLCWGCSKTSGYQAPEELVEVKGKVTLDGEPLSGATLSFIPDQGTEGTGGFAITDETGEFQALHYSQVEGLQPGSYKVVFSKLVTKDGETVPPGVDAADVGAIEKLPAHLVQLNPSNHPFLLSVNQSPQQIEYELKSKKGRNM